MRKKMSNTKKKEDMRAWKTEKKIVIDTDMLRAEITPVDAYVSGVARQTLLDKRTGISDYGTFGLDIVDFLMETDPDRPVVGQGGGEQEPTREEMLHGKHAKHYVELPQICTRARTINYDLEVGDDFVVVHQWWNYTEASPGYSPGSEWRQTVVFPKGKRYFFCCDTVRSVNKVGDLFIRIDLPGHWRHNRGDTFEEIWLSYHGHIPSSEFFQDFPPDRRFRYFRALDPVPERIIRAYKVRSPEGKKVWLAGMNLNPHVVSEAWCHERGYVCMIEELGRTPVNRGDVFSMANVVGLFDSPEEMMEVYDEYRGYASLVASKRMYCLSENVAILDGETSFHVEPWGLSPDGMTEGEWSGEEVHPDWRLAGVADSGSDPDDKVAGENSLWFRQDGGDRCCVEWDAQRDNKDISYYDVLRFSAKADRSVKWRQLEARFEDHQKRVFNHPFGQKLGKEWREIAISLEAGRFPAGFRRDQVRSIQFIFDGEGEYKVWFDNLRLARRETEHSSRALIVTSDDLAGIEGGEVVSKGEKGTEIRTKMGVTVRLIQGVEDEE